MLSVSFHTRALLLGSEKEKELWAPYCREKQRLLFSVYQTGVSIIWVNTDLHILLGKPRKLDQQLHSILPVIPETVHHIMYTDSLQPCKCKCKCPTISQYLPKPQPNDRLMCFFKNIQLRQPTIKPQKGIHLDF